MGNHRDITQAQQGTLWMQLQAGIPGAQRVQWEQQAAHPPGRAMLLPLHQCASLALKTTQGSGFFLCQTSTTPQPLLSPWGAAQP